MAERRKKAGYFNVLNGRFAATVEDMGHAPGPAAA